MTVLRPDKENYFHAARTAVRNWLPLDQSVAVIMTVMGFPTQSDVLQVD